MHRKLHKHLIPSHINAYRPHILRRGSLLFFVALIMVSEGIFVSNLFVKEGTLQVSQVQAVSMAAVGAAPSPASFVNSMGRAIVKFLEQAGPTVPWTLGIVATILSLAVIFAFFMHIQIQHPEMLFSGALVALFAFSLMITNIHIIGIM